MTVDVVRGCEFWHITYLQVEQNKETQSILDYEDKLPTSG